jgi:cell division protein FtsZ
MVFITAGMGGGTGTGAAPCRRAHRRQLGALTVAVGQPAVRFRGPPRGRQALDGLDELRSEVDTLIVIPNQRLLTSSARTRR